MYTISQDRAHRAVMDDLSCQVRELQNIIKGMMEHKPIMEHKGDYLVNLKEALKELYLLKLRPLHQDICSPHVRLCHQYPN